MGIFVPNMDSSVWPNNPLQDKHTDWPDIRLVTHNLSEESKENKRKKYFTKVVTVVSLDQIIFFNVMKIIGRINTVDLFYQFDTT